MLSVVKREEVTTSKRNEIELKIMIKRGKSEGTGIRTIQYPINQ